MAQPGENIMLEGLDAATADGVYLGNTDAVDILMRSFISDAADAIEAGNAEAVSGLIDTMALRFAGQEAGYNPIPDWSTRRDGIGLYVATHWGIDPNHTVVDILRGMFAMMAQEIIEWAKAGDSLDDEDLAFRTDALAERATATVTNTYEIVYPPE
jgi:hypothetical protein